MYATSRYGVRWYGDFRSAVPGTKHLFCLDLRFWYASRAYRYRPAPASSLVNRDGRRVTAAHRRRIAYAVWRFGRSGRPARQAAVMLYVHSQMGDARPGELDPSAAGPETAALFRRIASDAARYAGPYRIEAQLPGTLTVGVRTTAIVRVRAAGGRAVPGVPLALSATGAAGVVPRVRTDGRGVARISLTPSTASGLALHVRTGLLASTEPAVFAPTAGAARRNGQWLAAPAPQRVVATLARHDVVAVPQLAAHVTSPGLAVGSSVAESVTVTGLGGATTTVQVQLWGPFRTPKEIVCSGSPTWSGSVPVSGDTTTTSAAVTIDRAGYYGFRAAIAPGGSVAGAATECGLTSQTTFAVAHPSLATRVVTAYVRPGATIADRITVTGLGRTPSRVEAALYGPFGSRAAITCDTAHLAWKGSVDVAGNGEARTAPVKLVRAGFYGYREQVTATDLVAAAATACAPAEETALAVPEIVTGRGDVSRFAASPSTSPLRPVRIRIGSLGVDAAVAASGIDLAHGVLGIPQAIDRAGWWRDGALPGAGAGAILVAGHVDSARGGVGAFFPLQRARTGDRVELATASGRTFAYTVTSVRLYRKGALPTSVFATTGKARLVLVTCGGPFDDATGHYPDNVVVTAVPVR